MRKIVLTFGLIAGGIMAAMLCLAMMFQDQIGFDRGAIVGYTSMVLAFLMVFFGVRSYRDNVAGGSVKFGRAFLVGIAITGIATACYVATWEVVYYKFMPDFMDKYAAYEIANRIKSSVRSQESTHPSVRAAKCTQVELLCPSAGVVKQRHTMKKRRSGVSAAQWRPICRVGRLRATLRGRRSA